MNIKITKTKLQHELKKAELRGSISAFDLVEGVQKRIADSIRDDTKMHKYSRKALDKLSIEHKLCRTNETYIRLTKEKCEAELACLESKRCNKLTSSMTLKSEDGLGAT